MGEFVTLAQKNQYEKTVKIVARFEALRKAQPLASRNRLISEIVADPDYPVFSNVGCVKILKRAGVYDK